MAVARELEIRGPWGGSGSFPESPGRVTATAGSAEGTSCSNVALGWRVPAASARGSCP